LSKAAGKKKQKLIRDNIAIAINRESDKALVDIDDK